MEKIIAFIPARGGSKGIPRKNIKNLAGRPLIYWVLDAATRCDLIDKVYVATDDAEIAEVVDRFGSERVEVVSRGSETATDTASTESAMLEFSRQRNFEHMVLIQATSPLLEAGDLDRGIRKYLNNKADGLVSVVRQKRFYWQVADEGRAVPVNYDPCSRPRRQDFDGILVENGAFYVSRKDSLLKSGSRLSGHVVTYEMPEATYFEIDDEVDWQIIEGMLANRKISVTSEQSGKLKKVKLFLTDVDGVLTDAGMYYGESGEELKKFNTRDGKGIELLRNHGIKTGIITSEATRIVLNRAKKLKMDYVFTGIKDKLSVFNKLLLETGIDASETAYIGDDINDLEVLAAAGLSASPGDGVASVKRVVDYVCDKRGGEGCVREFVEKILE
ncbi:N-acetylneuraminate cytidylyltransferase [Syntrophotalea carbinolica DSM 2380]|uniref:N-acylneuraminate cytidylyltransferase n=1 Tax=Syntrophotalea carbinolica (strain DSM 2380 / NBRC 103641 / GraBd1) TaxID=338963 RepID=Q3A530_SYNC1|nr:acylneuraminate cytidylyltransferase [Syntrophotalea carbinolica]ABA88527.1 N-acetylneuraminate cytidylyltransferase [Syntrophotalea carbinolica DSM 2380]